MTRKRMWGVVFVLVAALLVSNGAPAAQAQEKPEAKPAEEKKKEEKKKEGLPLEPVRKIEFTTDEGTWLSLDAAPDGKTLVFEEGCVKCHAVNGKGGTVGPELTGVAGTRDGSGPPDRINLPAS